MVMERKFMVVLVLAFLLVLGSESWASMYINPTPNTGDGDYGLLSTAWDPGTNTARFGGNPAPGGATWSVMGAGLGDVSIGGQDPHGGSPTTFLCAFDDGGVDEITTIGLALDVWAATSGFKNLGKV